ncbi:hypothetical protein [Lysobacter gummosus]|uniref:hypothetical protein n=1 Tax=Lysobacter gummosus TaxID=262324 RepID=UPI00363FCC80
MTWTGWREIQHRSMLRPLARRQLPRTPRRLSMTARGSMKAPTKFFAPIVTQWATPKRPVTMPRCR